MRKRACTPEQNENTVLTKSPTCSNPLKQHRLQQTVFPQRSAVTPAATSEDSGISSDTTITVTSFFSEPTDKLTTETNFSDSETRGIVDAVLDIAESLEAKQALQKILTIREVSEIINNIFQLFNKPPKVIGLDEDQALSKCPFGACWECRHFIKDEHIIANIDEPTVYFNRCYPSSLHPYLILFELINLMHAREYIQQNIDFKLEKLSKDDLVNESDHIENTVVVATENILDSAKKRGEYDDDILNYSLVVLKEYDRRHTSHFFRHHAEKLVSDVTQSSIKNQPI